jgi:small-conductance mechanosensitive channel
MPNSEMVKGVIHNFKRLERRRVVFSVGVVYHLSAEKLKVIPAMIRELISKQDNTTFDRAHLKDFGDFSINFEIVYYIELADYMMFMDKHQAICLDIFEKFEQEKIEFAFPTQTIFVNKQENAGLTASN